ncbi:MAG: hypothetical protein IJ484_03780 [Oscillospiraceae bacterium]|nr:hypothetical protein [Oscillospiraceae bacterium]
MRKYYIRKAPPGLEFFVFFSPSGGFFCPGGLALAVKNGTIIMGEDFDVFCFLHNIEAILQAGAVSSGLCAMHGAGKARTHPARKL